MNGYYQIKQTEAGKIHFTLHAGNHEVILSSQLYTTRDSAEKGVRSARENGSKEERFEKKVSVKNEPYFLLKAANGQIIGVSQMYGSDAARAAGIKSVMTNSASEIKEDDV